MILKRLESMISEFNFLNKVRLLAIMLAIGVSFHAWAVDECSIEAPLASLYKINSPHKCVPAVSSGTKCSCSILKWAVDDKEDRVAGLLKSAFDSCMLNIKVKGDYENLSDLKKGFEARFQTRVPDSIMNSIKACADSGKSDSIQSHHVIAKSAYALDRLEKAQIELFKQLSFVDQYLESNQEDCHLSDLSQAKQACEYFKNNCSAHHEQKQKAIRDLTESCENNAREFYSQLRKPQNEQKKKIAGSIQIVRETCPWIFQEEYQSSRDIRDDFQPKYARPRTIDESLKRQFKSNRDLLAKNLAEMQSTTNCFTGKGGNPEICNPEALNKILNKTPDTDVNFAAKGVPDQSKWALNMSAEKCMADMSYERDKTGIVIKDQLLSTGLSFATLGAGTFVNAARLATASNVAKTVGAIAGVTGVAIDTTFLVQAGNSAAEACAGEQIEKLTSSEMICPVAEKQNGGIVLAEQGNCKMQIALALAQGIPVAAAASSIVGKVKGALVERRAADGIAKAKAKPNGTSKAISEPEAVANKRKLAEAETKVTPQSRSPQRQELVNQYSKKSYSTPAENEVWMKLARDSEEGKLVGAKFLDVENSEMKHLNDVTKDKDFITSLTNKNKEYVFEAIGRIQKKYPDIKIIPYSDFKSTRFAFTGKVPAGFEQELRKEISNSNKEFVKFMKGNDLVRGRDIPENWFRAGFGETADQATLAARYARNTKGQNLMQNLSEQSVQDGLMHSLQEAEQSRNTIQTSLGKSDLLETIAGTDKKTLTIEAFDLIRKAESSVELIETLKKTHSVSLKPEQAEELIKYVRSVDEFNPGIHIGERVFATLKDAEKGGASTDFAGMGAANLNGTAKALARAEKLDIAIRLSRQEEAAVTKHFQAKRDKFYNRVTNYFTEKKKMEAAKITCSGDDCVVVASRHISQKEKNELIQRLSRDDRPAGMRMAFISSKITNPEIRNEMAAHGESIEKALRVELRGVLSQEKLSKILFGVDMQGLEKGQGAVRLIIGNSQERLTPEERKLIEAAFEKSVKGLKVDKLPSNYFPVGLRPTDCRVLS